MTTYIITGRTAKLTVVDEVDLLPEDGSMMVKIVSTTKKRSDAQNKLMWLWNTQVGKEYGDTKDGIHLDCKERFAVPILIRDDEAFADVWGEVENLRSPDIKRKFIDKCVSTSNFSTKQFTEYLKEYEHYWEANNIQLPHPEDIYYMALGR